MTPGPLPPHERAWRHPSELAAPAHEPTSRLGHFLIGSTAALSLLLVAWLAISMTPKRYGDVNEVRTAASGSAASTSFGLAAGSPPNDLTPAERVLRVMSTIFAAQSRQGDSVSTVAATFIGGADRPAATGAVVTPEVAAVPTSSVLAPATAPAVADTAAAIETAAVGEVASDEGGHPESSDAAVQTDTTEPLDTSSDPAAPAESSSTTTSSTSSTSSTTSTSTTSSTTTSSTSTTSSTTIAPSGSPKQFS